MEGEARATEPRGGTFPQAPGGTRARASASPDPVFLWKLVVLAPKFTGVTSSDFTSFLPLAPGQSSAAACEGPFPGPFPALPRPVELCPFFAVGPAAPAGPCFAAGPGSRRT